MSFKELFNLSFWELLLLAIKDDIVLFIRLWPLWIIMIIIMVIVFIKYN